MVIDMKINELIAQLEAIRNKHGDDVVVMHSDFDYNMYGSDDVSFEVVEDEDSYPKDWNMPMGMKFVNIKP